MWIKTSVILGVYAFVVCGSQPSMPSIFLIPSILYSLRQGLSLIGYAVNPVSFGDPLVLASPSIGITDSGHSACFYMNSGEPFSLHSKYLMEGNNLPSPSLSITRRWDSRQMCPGTIILYRIFLANLIFSLNITECIRPMSGHNENSVSFISKFKFMLPYDSLPYNHPAPQEKIVMRKYEPYLYRKSSLTLPSPSLSCS